MIVHCIKFIILCLLLNTQLVNADSTQEPANVEKSNDLVINRINLSDEKKAKFFTTAHLNDSHENLSVKWLGNGSSVMIILAKNNKAKNNALRTTNLYISYDYGENFAKEERLKLKDGSPAILNTFITSKVNNSHLIFTDIINNYLFISDDYGKTYDSVSLEFAPKNLQMHSTLSTHIIASDDSESAKLYLSKDFGRTWKAIHSNVSKFFWAPFENQDRIYLLYNMDENKKGLKCSDDYFENFLFLKNNVKDLKICGKYVTYTQYNKNLGSSTPNNKYITLSVGYNNSSPSMARNSGRSLLNMNNFIVADCTDSELIVAGKSHNATNYDLYISDLKGTRLKMVLNNVIVSQSNGKTTIDLHRVAGLNNIYIANAYESATSTNIVSLITNDSGFSWKKINLTQVQSDEIKKFKCSSDTCNLHFLQNSILQPNSMKYPGIISKESSVGIILANGIIDEHLKDDTKVKQVPETYVSRDAGENWKRISDGKYLFNIGDNGGLIVGVKHFSKSVATKTLIYSLDDGYSFNEIQFTNESMRVYNLLTENGEKTSVFTIFGSMDNKTHSWTLVKVNLTSLYNRTCEKDDFEYWQPHSNSNTKCVMGLKTKLLRRKSNAICLHGEDFERKNKPQLCDCTRDDYVCDFGFIENENRSCVPIDLEEFMPECDPKYYTRTIIEGYFKIPGNQCLPTKDSIYENNVRIGCRLKPKREIFKTLFFSLILTSIVFAGGYFGFMRFKNRQKRSTHLNTHYSRRTDSAILLDDDALGEESHVRHGFTDDVPMVIS